MSLVGPGFSIFYLPEFEARELKDEHISGISSEGDFACTITQGQSVRAAKQGWQTLVKINFPAVIDYLSCVDFCPS